MAGSFGRRPLGRQQFGSAAAAFQQHHLTATAARLRSTGVFGTAIVLAFTATDFASLGWTGSQPGEPRLPLRAAVIDYQVGS